MRYQSLSSWICFGERNPPYPPYGSNIPARRLRHWFHFLQRSGSSPRYSSWRISKVRFCCVCRLDYHLNPNTSLLDSCELTMSRYLFQNLSTKTTIYITFGLAKDISEPKTSLYYSRGCGIIKAKAVKAYCRNRRSSMTVYEAKTPCTEKSETTSLIGALSRVGWVAVTKIYTE